MEEKKIFICETCGKEHDGSYGSGRFCSSHCSHHSFNHSWKNKNKFISVPCETFKEFLKSNNISFYPEYTDLRWSHNYSLDVAFVNEKTAIEINGNQHYDENGNLKKYYQDRHDYLISQGWKIIEVPFRMVWNEEFRIKIINDIKNNIDFSYNYSEMMQEQLNIQNEKYRQEHICPQCGGIKKYKYSKLCDSCRRNNRTVKPPSKEELQKMVFEMPITKLSIKLGVSHRLIEKWCKQYKIEKPIKGYWAKKQYENHVPYTNAEHGTMARYRFGCRCEQCKKACRDRDRQKRLNRTEEQREEINRKRREKRKLKTMINMLKKE